MVRFIDYYRRLVDKYLDVERATDNVAAYIYDQFNYHHHDGGHDDDLAADGDAVL